MWFGSGLGLFMIRIVKISVRWFGCGLGCFHGPLMLHCSAITVRGMLCYRFTSRNNIDMSEINKLTTSNRHYHSELSCHMGKPTICLGENKGADQFHSNCEADQRLCFRYSDSTVTHLLKSKI